MSGISPTFTQPKNAYQYNGKEHHAEFDLNWNDYGARWYDPQVGRWWSVDPLAEKYAPMSPYNYVANNPLIYIDPDGRDIEVVQKKDVTHINVKAVLIDKTENNYSRKEMRSFKKRISRQIKESYSIDGTTIKAKVNIRLKVVKNEKQIKSDDHMFRIMPNGSEELLNDQIKPDGSRASSAGTADFDSKQVWLNEKIIEEGMPATTGEYAGTGKTSTGRPTLERTAAHEFGHVAGHKGHPPENTLDGNLMHQTRRKNAGLIMTERQMLDIRYRFSK